MGFFEKKRILNTNKCITYSAVYKSKYIFTYLVYIHVVTYSYQIKARGTKGRTGNAAEMASKAKLMG